MLHNMKCLYLHRVFHGIRFKVNNGNWLSVRMAFFYALFKSMFCSMFWLTMVKQANFPRKI